MALRIGQSDGNGDNGQGVAMTLSTIAYDSDTIPAMLSQYAPGWEAVWVPAAGLNGNFAYIAYNQSAQQYAIAIRGSVPDFNWTGFQDWFEQDFNIFQQMDWNYPESGSNPKISLGAYKGLSDLAEITAPAYGNSQDQMGILDF